MTGVQNIVLVHGGFVDGSGWRGVYDVLTADGFSVSVVQNQTLSLESDVETTTNALDLQDGPAILVGHSYGGTLITHAGTDSRVAALVYIAALAPDADETSQSLQQKFPGTDVFSHIEIADGRIWLKPDGVGYFAGDLPEAEQKLIWATQAVPVPDLFTQKVEGTAWKTKPSWYIVGKNDRTVHPDLERFVAKRMGATTVELASSHVPMLSQPQAVLDVIRKAVAAVQKA
jgi:pimeloyl-ACP methyl ester carboxylesterase